jgi:hypothetical protein
MVLAPGWDLNRGGDLNSLREPRGALHLSKNLLSNLTPQNYTTIPKLNFWVTFLIPYYSSVRVLIRIGFRLSNETLSQRSQLGNTE